MAVWEKACLDILVIASSLALLTHTAQGFSSGSVPARACKDGPDHPGEPQNTPTPYTIRIMDADGQAVREYRPGQTLTGKSQIAEHLKHKNYITRF